MSWSSKVVKTLVLLYRRVHRYLATSHSFCYKGRNVVPPRRNTIARSSSSTLLPVASLDIVCEYSCLATRESSKEIEFAYLLTFASESRGWHGEKDQKSEESRSSNRRKLVRGFTSWNTSKHLLLRRLFRCLRYCSLSSSFQPSTILVADSQWLRTHQSFHVVTAVISTDYILVRNFLFQGFDAIRGHVVSNLQTETPCFHFDFDFVRDN